MRVMLSSEFIVMHIERDGRGPVAVARAIGVSYVTMWRWMVGERKPTAAHAAALARELRIPAKAFLRAIESS